ncbi:hypothetical protein ACH4A8_35695 [Streptomyces vietnamensis]|uniref:hypothetical protein n=1 Tax=Streptomyces vietnamensis TaxID=362257 RepID=UPI0034300C5D
MRADLRLSLTAAVAAVALAASTAPALAEETPAGSPLVGIGRAVTDDTQRGVFEVTAWTDAPQAKVTAVSARIRQGDTVVATVPTLVPGDSWDPRLANTFRLPAEATLKLVEDGGTIPSLGTYAIDVTATDSLGNKLTRADAGRLDFRLRPEFVSFGVGVPAWDDRNARPQGTLSAVQPGSGDIVPLPDRTVTVRRDGAAADETPRALVTSAAGDFTGEPYAVAGPGDTFTASFTEDSAEVHGSVSASRSVSEMYKPLRATATAAADRKRALSGETVTINGRLTDPAAAGAPLADQPVRVAFGPQVANVRTGADGRFTAKLLAFAGSGQYEWEVTSGDPFLVFDRLSGPLAVPLESRLDLRSASLSADGTLTVSVNLRALYMPDASMSQQDVQLEQSVDGGWKRVPLRETVLSWEDITLRAGSRGGWFRVRHLTTDELAGATSPSFRLARFDTRIVSLNAGPEPVAKGGYVTATGSLQHYWDGAWRAYGNAPVVLQFQAKGSTTWKTVASGRSGSTGKVSLKATASADGSWRIYCFGDYRHFNSPASAGGDYVDVR